MAATDFADRSVGLSSGVKANIPMTREALVLGWCMAEPHARNQLAMLGLFILYLGAHVPGRAIGQLAAEAALLGPGHVLTWVCQLAHPQICALRAHARGQHFRAFSLSIAPNYSLHKTRRHGSAWARLWSLPDG